MLPLHHMSRLSKKWTIPNTKNRTSNRLIFVSTTVRSISIMLCLDVLTVIAVFETARAMHNWFQVNRLEASVAYSGGTLTTRPNHPVFPLFCLLGQQNYVHYPDRTDCLQINSLTLLMGRWLYHSYRTKWAKRTNFPNILLAGKSKDVLPKRLELLTLR